MQTQLHYRLSAFKDAWGRRLLIGAPYLWLLLFFLIPFAIVVKISFSMADIAIPPYTAIVGYADEMLSLHLNLGNYIFLVDDELYLFAYLTSIKLALISTIFCLFLGYAMSRGPGRQRERKHCLCC